MTGEYISANTALAGLALLCAGEIIRRLNTLGKGQNDQAARLVRVETALTGVKGDNGLVGEVQQLRKRSHAHSNELNALKGQHEIYELRFDAVERRNGPNDRRTAE